ncbi:MAG: epoxyqueuosine reductase [Endomicrobia bacterium]|nr:epoxyqueuosine reductase [Endomicrobiia bacterium]
MKAGINSETVKEYGLNAGASVVGIAASKDFGLAQDGFRPCDNLEGCLSVIVFGAPFPQEALTMNAVEYTEIRNAMLTKMTGIAKEVEKLIKADGYKAKAISASGGKYIEGKHYGHISLKHAAELAGLGIIGRNYLLTNNKYGNLLWFSAVLTDAELVPDKKAQYKICDNCNKCVKTCPSGALDNSVLFKNKECSKFYKIVNRKLEIQCFLCRKVCPYRFGK